MQYAYGFSDDVARTRFAECDAKLQGNCGGVHALRFKNRVKKIRTIDMNDWLLLRAHLQEKKNELVREDRKAAVQAIFDREYTAVHAPQNDSATAAKAADDMDAVVVEDEDSALIPAGQHAVAANAGAMIQLFEASVARMLAQHQQVLESRIDKLTALKGKRAQAGGAKAVASEQPH